jgi:hypothetical protein
MGPQPFHALNRISKRSKCRPAIVSRYHANVVFQFWEEILQPSHSTFVHIDVEITDMEQGETVEGTR